MRTHQTTNHRVSKGNDNHFNKNILNNIHQIDQIFLTYLEHFDDIRWKLHHGRAGHTPVDAIDEDPSPDGMGHRPELGFFVGLASCCRQLPGEGGGKPFSDLRRDSVGLNLRQLVVLVGQPPEKPRRCAVLNFCSTVLLTMHSKRVKLISFITGFEFSLPIIVFIVL